jgi:hypothetical protein
MPALAHRNETLGLVATSWMRSPSLIRNSNFRSLMSTSRFVARTSRIRLSAHHLAREGRLVGVCQPPVSMHIRYLWASPSVLNLVPTL